jgi:hypothetical protein
MRLRKALATEGAYLIPAMAEALDRSTYVYIQDIYESKSDTGPSHCLGLHSKSSMCASQLLAIFGYFKGLSISAKKGNSRLRI